LDRLEKRIREERYRDQEGISLLAENRQAGEAKINMVEFVDKPIDDFLEGEKKDADH
jgi:hypothetical protein